MGRYNRKHERVYANPGERYKTLYSVQFDENGCIELVETGKKDVYADIQMWTESCKIQNILERYQQGEIDVLKRAKGFYADVSEFPKTYSEVFNRIQETQHFFDGLPVEIKQRYNNDYRQFLATSKLEDFALKREVKQNEQKHDGEVQ